jgi:hypothetical protein
MASGSDAPLPASPKNAPVRFGSVTFGSDGTGELLGHGAVVLAQEVGLDHTSAQYAQVQDVGVNVGVRLLSGPAAPLEVGLLGVAVLDGPCERRVALVRGEHPDVHPAPRLELEHVALGVARR